MYKDWNFCLKCTPKIFLFFRFEIIQDPESWLAINHATGQITARASLKIRSPHVRNNIYSAIVKVIDQGEHLRPEVKIITAE